MDSPIALLALPLVVIFSASLASAESKLVNEVCSKTKDYSSCVAALQLDPRAAKATTLRSLGIIALQIASKDTAGSRKDVDQLLADPRRVPHGSRCSSLVGLTSTPRLCSSQ
ncbi:hypothetical protein NL676_001855 [Syzygium grande]|nr:hypothetical protein NL676_001855 [Syzygium grande]